VGERGATDQLTRSGMSRATEEREANGKTLGKIEKDTEKGKKYVQSKPKPRERILGAWGPDGRRTIKPTASTRSGLTERTVKGKMENSLGRGNGKRRRQQKKRKGIEEKENANGGATIKDQPIITFRGRIIQTKEKGGKIRDFGGVMKKKNWFLT